MLIMFLLHDNLQDFRNFMYFVECVVDAYIVVLRHLSGRKLVCSYSFTSVHPWTFKRILLACSVFNLLSWECLLILSL